MARFGARQTRSLELEQAHARATRRVRLGYSHRPHRRPLSPTATTANSVHWLQAMSHALLLRLFLSPSFFSVHVALRYLNTYSDNIGITYYLTRRLSEYSVDELRDVWGFIWCVSPQQQQYVVGLTPHTVTCSSRALPSLAHSNVSSRIYHASRPI